MLRCFGIFGVLLATSGAAQYMPPTDYSGTYYCKMTASAGLHLNKQLQQWEPIIFNVDDVAYTVKVINTGDIHQNQYLGDQLIHLVNVREFGSSEEARNCVGRQIIEGKYGEKIPIGASGDVTCRYFGSEYRLNFKTLRMQVSFDGGYMDDWSENQDTPYVAVGKCDKIG
ncbi:hypothetical protein [Sinorhizobium sp. BG8]|uniref:hypothetical protein n=1 Tax=Sinorhizobium sp. BG8 TaxID=2613773 RepID=UPI00193EB392|nr:hypothetical protein [Sinorhizobium sp. BG8]QRM54726.1 hypothetical protein F3Y30_09360 [Sinorhizobium sp. BG8]